MNKKKFLQRIVLNQNNIKFNDVVVLVESFGFSLDRVNGSHHIFKHKNIPVLINIQRVKDEVKPYQVRQLLKIIENHNLKITD
ncbi:MAG: type II toxin-antitoxin system HicA family toxin [Bacteroidales bacterium]